MSRRGSPASVVEQLAALFQRNGYVRRLNPKRREKEGHRKYKKGDEIRFVAESKAELATIRSLLEEAGFRPGRPYAQAGHFRQPVYGREAVSRFLELIGVQPAVPRDATAPRRRRKYRGRSE